MAPIHKFPKGQVLLFWGKRAVVACVRLLDSEIEFTTIKILDTMHHPDFFFGFKTQSF
jgi:hypothetical protein